MKYKGLTDKQRKGFDIIIKIINKKYPFVVGWDEHDDWDKYHYILYIDLVVDLTKYMEYFNSELWGGTILNEPYTTLTEPIASIDEFDKVREIQESIKDYMGRIYNILPEEYVVKYDQSFNYPDDVKSLRTLSIGSFRFINPPPLEDGENIF